MPDLWRVKSLKGNPGSLSPDGSLAPIDPIDYTGPNEINMYPS